MIQSAYQGNEKYIFISYCHKDAARVFPFIEELQKKYNVWYDEGIKYGREWTHEIIEKLEGCSLFIFLITERSLKSENCLDEIHAAKEANKKFINVLFDSKNILTKDFKFRYGRFQMCEVRRFENYEEAVKDLERKSNWFRSVRKVGAAHAVKDKPSTSTDGKAAPKKTVPLKGDKNLINAKAGDVIRYGKYVQNKKNTPIEWVVLAHEKNELILVTKKVLFSYRNGGWLYSRQTDIALYLNKYFLETAFNENERSALGKFRFKNAQGIISHYTVSMLDTEDIAHFFPHESMRLADATPYAKECGTKTSLFSNRAAWSLLAVSEDSVFPYVNAKGQIRYSKKRNYGIRPIIRILLTKLK